MRCLRVYSGCLAVAIGAILGRPSALLAQVQLVDDIILLSQGQRKRERSRTEVHLGGNSPQSESALGPSPGSGETVWGVVPSSNRAPPSLAMPARDVLSAASAPPGRPVTTGSRLAQVPAALPSVEALPIYGPLEIPALDEMGPVNGWTLDAAINQLTSSNYDLRAKFREIPKAQADVLSAGLRNNPLIFAAVDSVPYGSYSIARPGDTSYSATVIQPFDVNQKRRARVAVATRAKQVLEAQYQDAVRLEIDALYSAFVDVLAARESVRYAQAGLAGFDAVVATAQKLVQGQEEASTELDRLTAQREAAAIALEQSHMAFEQAQQSLAALMGIPDEASQQLQIQGSIRESAVAVPPVEDLLGLGMQLRPDLAAYRMGINRAQADVTLARREAIPDVFVLYTPYSQQINTPVGAQNSSGWGIGAFTSIPLLNRNQGNIARAQQTVAQTRIESQGIERRIATEIRRAHLDYMNAKSAVERLESAVLPKVRRVRDAKYRLLTLGQEQALVFLDAQREYNEIVRQYRDSLIRRRRAQLRLNTAVGQRLFP